MFVLYCPLNYNKTAGRIYYDSILLQNNFDVADKFLNIPVRVVALHSWVWLVFATETELLQREILGQCMVVILNFAADGAADSFLC